MTSFYTSHWTRKQPTSCGFMLLVSALNLDSSICDISISLTSWCDWFDAVVVHLNWVTEPVHCVYHTPLPRFLQPGTDSGLCLLQRPRPQQWLSRCKWSPNCLVRNWIPARTGNLLVQALASAGFLSKQFINVSFSWHCSVVNDANFTYEMHIIETFCVFTSVCIVIVC